MKLRSLVLTIAVLAVLAAIVAFVRRPAPPPSADARLGQPVADRATIEQAAKFRLTDQGKTVTLARQSDGTWRVTSYYDFPADFQKLSRFIDELTTAKLDRLVTTNPERIARLEFKDTQIALADAADKTLWSVTLGKTAETGGRFLRFGDEKKAFLANLNTWIDPDSKNWADAQLVHLKPEDIAKIELTFPDAPTATVTFTRAKKEDPWTSPETPTNQRVKPDQITSLLASLTSLRFSDTVEPTDPKAADAKSHTRTAKLTTFDNKTLTIALGRRPEEKKLKPPTPSNDGKSSAPAAAPAKEGLPAGALAKEGPASLGSITDLAKKSEPASTGDTANSEPKTQNSEPAVSKPAAPEFDTIPAGPVFASIASSDAAAPINTLMQKRAFEISDYVFTSLPKAPTDLFEPAPPPPSTAPAPVPSVPKTP